MTTARLVSSVRSRIFALLDHAGVASGRLENTTASRNIYAGGHGVDTVSTSYEQRTKSVLVNHEESTRGLSHLPQETSWTTPRQVTSYRHSGATTDRSEDTRNLHIERHGQDCMQWRKDLWHGTWEDPVPIHAKNGSNQRHVACTGAPGRCSHPTQYILLEKGKQHSCPHPGCRLVYKLVD